MKKLLKKSLKHLAKDNIFSLPRKILKKPISIMIEYGLGSIVEFEGERRSKDLEKINKVNEETQMLMTNDEAYKIIMATRNSKKVPGDIAEVGVYKGGTAKLICEEKGEKSLHLFDTFEGLPEIKDIDKSKHRKGQYPSNYYEVKKYLKNYPKVNFYQGIFPSTADQVKDKKFSFVHLDVDIYESTLEALKFFFPRMSKGGVIISHDYVMAPGVRKAFDEFFEKKAEPVLDISQSQCLVVKT